MKAVQIVTIKEKVKIYKNGEPAERIELIRIEENGFEMVSQSDLYQVGDQVIYIQPDYCLPDDESIFDSFVRPGGDSNKSRLGKNGRIRAIKFNFNIEENNEAIYSMGILLPIDIVKGYIEFKLEKEVDLYSDECDLDLILNVKKHEDPDSAFSGQTLGDMPSGMYKTDEDNFENIKNKIEYPIKLIGTLKVDGSSITCYTDAYGGKGICSRSLEKKLDQSFIQGYKNEQGQKLRKHYDRDTNTKGWYNEDTSEFFVDVPDTYEAIIEQTDDTWVKLGTPVLNKLIDKYNETGASLAVRGEIVGQGLKGSGNKNNPHAKDKQKMYVYGIDDYSKGITRKLPMCDVVELCKEMDLEMVPIVFIKEFNSEKELRDECLSYFKQNLIEGIVLRTYDSARLSTKFMNLEYDSRK